LLLLSAIFNESEPFIFAASTSNSVKRTIFTSAEMIFNATATMFLVPKNIVFETAKMESNTPSIVSGSGKIIIVSEKIIFYFQEDFLRDGEDLSRIPAGFQESMPCGLSRGEDFL